MAQIYYNPYGYGTRSKYRTVKTPWGFDTTFHEDDDMYNIGAALGTLWGANYNQRGADGAEKTAKKIYEDYMAGLQSGNNSVANQGSVTGSDYLRKPMDENGNIIPQMYSNNNTTLLDTAYTPSATKSGLQADKPNPAWEYRNTYLSQYQGGSVNPATEQRQVQQDVDGMKKLANNIDPLKIADFNPDVLKARVRAQLQKDGRNEWQIEQAMKQLDPMIVDKKAEYDAANISKLQEVYNQAVGNGDLLKAGIAQSKIATLNPAIGKGMATDLAMRSKFIGLGQEFTWKYNKALEQGWTEEQATRYAISGETPWARADKEEEKSLKWATVNAKNKSGGDGTMTTQMMNAYLSQYKSAEATLKRLQEKIDSGVALNPDEQQDYNNSRADFNALHNILFSAYQPKRIDWNNENDVTYVINDLKAKGASQEKINTYIKSKVNDELYKKLIG